MKRKTGFAFILVFLFVFSTIGFAIGEEPQSARVIIRFDRNEPLQEIASNLRGKGYNPQVLRVINGIAVQASPRAIEALEERFQVISVRKDEKVFALPKPDRPPGKPPEENPEDPPEGQEIDWGVLEIRADAVWPAYTGLGVKVAVLDTGIDIDHPDLDVDGGANFDPKAKSYDDNNGHGTHVAGTIAALDNGYGVIGVAPGADLYAVKVLDRKGSGWISQIILGIEWSIANGMDVMNLSLGSDYPNQDLADALELAEEAGMIIVAAAGNDTVDVDFPGAYPSTIAVGAINPDRTLASFSSRGPQVDVVAPGVAITSTYKGGGYRDLQGTSMATPHVAGLAALYIQKHGNANLADFRSAVQVLSTDLGDPGFDYKYGWGLVDAYRLLIQP